MRNTFRLVTACSLLTLTGCVQIVPPEDFVRFASTVALDPVITCATLANDFGLPNVPTVNNPGEIGLSYIEERIPVADGVSLRGWYIPAVDSRGLIIFSNGAVGELPCYLFLTLNLVQRGWSVAMYDYEGFGGSDGSASLGNLTRDADAGIQWALNLTGESQALLMGVSLGTIPSVAYAADHPDQVIGVVLDGPISLAAEVERFGFLLGSQPARFAAQFDSALRLDQTLPRLSRPTFAIIYGLDEYATAAIAPDLLATVPGPVATYRFDTLRHARGPYLSTDEYFDALDAWLGTTTGR